MVVVQSGVQQNSALTFFCPITIGGKVAPCANKSVLMNLAVMVI